MLPIKDDIPTRRFPIVTVVIIAINVFVYFGLQGGWVTNGLDTARYSSEDFDRLSAALSRQRV